MELTLLLLPELSKVTSIAARGDEDDISARSEGQNQNYESRSLPPRRRG
jgi:hypothetical protein